MHDRVPEVHSKPCQTSKLEHFVKIVKFNGVPFSQITPF